MCNTVSGRFAGALQVGNEKACSKRQAILSRFGRRLSNFRCINQLTVDLVNQIGMRNLGIMHGIDGN